MPGFSFTAPIITIEEEEQERRELSPVELARLEEDLFGPPEPITSLGTPLTDENTNDHNVVVQEDLDPSDDEEDTKAVVATSSTITSTSTLDVAGADVHVPEGSSSPSPTPGDTFSSTRTAVEDLVHQVQEFILQMTPLEQRDYMEAMERVPDLVQTESNPVRMLQCEENNVPVRASS
jgi:hypothetical protein